MSTTMLELEGVSRSFGGLKAVDGVSFTARAGQITALIGPNGAGKTTLINLITGVLSPTAGSIRLANTPLLGHDAADRARMGIARSYQTPQMIQGLSALDNVATGADIYSSFGIADVFCRPWRVRADNLAGRTQAQLALQRAGLHQSRWDVAAQSLSYGDQRRVEIARCLAQKPRLMVLDEPAAGLNPAETRGLGRDLSRLADEGMTILLVEHDMSLVMSVAHHVVVVNFGRLLTAGPPDDVRRNPQVIEAYLGHESHEVMHV